MKDLFNGSMNAVICRQQIFTTANILLPLIQDDTESKVMIIILNVLYNSLLIIFVRLYISFYRILKVFANFVALILKLIY